MNEIAVPAAATGAEDPFHKLDDVFRTGDTVRRWIGFALAGQLYGVPILSVLEVLAQADIEPIPGASPEVLGAINLRGQIVTVIDLRMRLGLPPPDAAVGPLVVFDTPKEILAVRVDRVTHVRQIADQAIKPPARSGSSMSGSIVGMVTQGGVMTLLDVSSLV